MAVKLTDNDLQRMGLILDPADPAKVVRLEDVKAQQPAESWDLEALAQYAAAGLGEASRLRSEAACLAKRSTVQIYRAGHALTIARRKLKREGRGRWGNWLKEHDIPRTNAWEAIQLFRHAESEQEVADMTPTQAKRAFGLARERKRPEVESPPRRSSSRCRRKANRQPTKRMTIPFSVVSSDDGGRNVATPESSVTVEIPPPKENPYTLLMDLVRIGWRLEYCLEGIAEIDWEEEPKAEYRAALDRAGDTLGRIREAIR